MSLFLKKKGKAFSIRIFLFTQYIIALLMNNLRYLGRMYAFTCFLGVTRLLTYNYGVFSTEILFWTELVSRRHLPPKNIHDLVFLTCVVGTHQELYSTWWRGELDSLWLSFKFAFCIEF